MTIGYPSATRPRRADLPWAHITSPPPTDYFIPLANWRASACYLNHVEYVNKSFEEIAVIDLMSLAIQLYISGPLISDEQDTWSTKARPTLAPRVEMPSGPYNAAVLGPRSSSIPSHRVM
jgi:hypothetical protein